LFVGIGLTTISLLYGLETFEAITGLLLGFAITLLSVIIHLMGNLTTVLHLISFTINSITVGWSISSVYTYLEVIPSKDDIFLVGAIMGMIGLSLVVLFQITKNAYYKKGLYIVTTTLLLLSTIILWFSIKELLYSLFIFYAIIVIFHSLSYVLQSDDLETFRKHKSIISFSHYILVSIIALVIVSEGEALQGLEGLGHIGSSKDKKAT
jgi:hypothetical protein